MQEKEIEELLSLLKNKYPEPETALNYSTEFELLLATILSAQTTDKQVNRVTEDLFSEYNGPEDFASLDREELAEKICSIGLYRNKSKYIIATSKMILEKFAGKVPDNRRDLLKLPGVGRKTANVVLACAFSRNTVPVDTHVRRVANRIGLVDTTDVDKIEKQIENRIPESCWSDLHHWLIFHGRETCKARNPRCEECIVSKLCQYYRYI